MAVQDLGAQIDQIASGFALVDQQDDVHPAERGDRCEGQLLGIAHADADDLQGAHAAIVPDPADPRPPPISRHLAGSVAHVGPRRGRPSLAASPAPAGTSGRVGRPAAPQPRGGGGGSGRFDLSAVLRVAWGDRLLRNRVAGVAAAAGSTYLRNFGSPGATGSSATADAQVLPWCERAN